MGESSKCVRFIWHDYKSNKDLRFYGVHQCQVVIDPWRYVYHQNQSWNERALPFRLITSHFRLGRKMSCPFIRFWAVSSFALCHWPTQSARRNAVVTTQWRTGSGWFSVLTRVYCARYTLLRDGETVRMFFRADQNWIKMCWLLTESQIEILRFSGTCVRSIRGSGSK